MNPNERERASFLKENFVPILEAGRLKFLEIKQDMEFCPGFRIRFFNGHTEALMAPLLESGQWTKTPLLCRRNAFSLAYWNALYHGL